MCGVCVVFVQLVVVIRFVVCFGVSVCASVKKVCLFVLFTNIKLVTQARMHTHAHTHNTHTHTQPD